ncbi:ComEC/Rec2 family competence protein [Candidatus Cyrtobacter comes]|uniref:ComEC/Rec2 family competence protein n=2 Tax=Candidatus Cyrtobacter comes TaxID=675776 RepID=A0ABU5LAB3_9RICK|nr:ComEC/Rec2 family competence protein [Candidatus Cyrtobacter comes]
MYYITIPIAFAVFYKCTDDIFRILSCIIFLVVLGMGVSYLRVTNIKTEVLEQKQEDIWIKGKVNWVENRDNGKRIYVENVKIFGKIFDLIRLNSRAKNQNLSVGDYIKAKVTIFPPPTPVISGGFDFFRFAYFKKIGAIGYTKFKPIILEKNQKISSINELRKKIIERVELAIKDGAKSSIAIALLVGDASSINKQVYDAMRKSGTAHLVAISGMHMALVAGMLFYVIRFIAVMICYKFQWVNTKKIAALFAIFSSFAYLLISGSPISAQRAFLMSLIFFIAILLDIRSSAIHSLCAAVTILLIFLPESLVSPSFQMSISACVGLICSGSLYIKSKYKIFSYIINVIIASTVAWLSTAMFSAYHFHQISVYSLFANLILVPITEFIGMPCGILGMLLIPFGLEELPLYILGYVCSIIASVSVFFSEIQNSYLFIVPFEGYLLGIYSIGLFFFAVMGGIIRYIGLCITIISTIFILSSKLPDVIGTVNKGCI